MSRFAIYDTQDKCWIGDEKGVRVFTDCELNGKPITGNMLSRIVMTAMNEQFNPDPTKPPRIRFRRAPYTGNATKLKDQITAPITGVEALIRYEARV